MTNSSQNLVILSSTSPLSLAEEIIASSPEYIQSILKIDYALDIEKLPYELQEEMLESWQGEDIKNMGVFTTLFHQIKGKSRKESFSQTERFIEIVTIADAILTSGWIIQAEVGNLYDEDIRQEGTWDVGKGETITFFRETGINLQKSEDITNPSVQEILSARAMCRIFIKNELEILREKPKLSRPLETISSLRFKVGIRETLSVLDISKLLIDQGRERREKIATFIASRNPSHPYNPISRENDSIRCPDIRDASLSYVIDMDRTDVVLRRSLSNLEITHEWAFPDEKLIDRRVDLDVELRKIHDVNRTLIASLQSNSLLDFEDGEKWEDFSHESPQVIAERKQFSYYLLLLGDTATLTEEKLQIIHKIKQIYIGGRDSLFQEVGINLAIEKMEKIGILMDVYKKRLELQIPEIIESLEKQKRIESSIQSLPPIEVPVEQFAEVADHNLHMLISLGFDILGDELKDAFIEAINSWVVSHIHMPSYYNLATKKIERGSEAHTTLATALLNVVGKGKLADKNALWIETDRKTWSQYLENALKAPTGSLVDTNWNLRDSVYILSKLEKKSDSPTKPKEEIKKNVMY